MIKIIATASMILFSTILYADCDIPCSAHFMNDCMIRDIKSALPRDLEKDPRDIVERVRVYRLAELLDLTEEQSIRFFPQLKELKRLREEFRLNQEKILQQLEECLRKPFKKDTDLKSLIDELEQLKRKFYEDETKIHKEISKILSPEQYAKFLMFQAHFGKEIREMIREAARRHKKFQPRLRF
ncbi:MAG: hypothetical protein ABIK10_04785 [candidate division WOR-3 bacterium]